MSSLADDPKKLVAFGIRVEGMTCKYCVARIENVISATPGVAAASVNPSTAHA